MGRPVGATVGIVDGTFKSANVDADVTPFEFVDIGDFVPDVVVDVDIGVWDESDESDSDVVSAFVVIVGGAVVVCTNGDSVGGDAVGVNTLQPWHDVSVPDK